MPAFHYSNLQLDKMAAVAGGEHNDGGGVEQYRDLIVDGDFYHALDLGRRLLQVDGSGGLSQREETAHLLLDRLRSNGDDSSDHANALLRMLANYATPTTELTEELLSLLFFCDHRVQIIHHLAKLTYQSRDCVRLVLNAYIELLSSDRLLLVPILGSLADLPLQATDKAMVVDATESLLDAVNEDDLPAVVQSLLTMLVPSSAQRIVSKIHRQCNRLTNKTTLALTFEVILRHAVVGSSALQAFLRIIRQCEIVTVFDVLLLALLLERPRENPAAMRSIALVVSKSKLPRRIIHDTVQRLKIQHWNEAFPAMVKLASGLLASCFNAFTVSSAQSTIESAVDLLGYLVKFRTTAQEEALALLLSIVSQPLRLMLSSSSTVYKASMRDLCWNVARQVADQLAIIAQTVPASLSPFAHIFLDHLYSITSSNHYDIKVQGGVATSVAYPMSILESLCQTLITLVKHEPAMVSLIMITIQKQLITPVSGLVFGLSATGRNRTMDALQLKQLMAVFLASAMLRQAVGEQHDRVSLLSWVQKLVSSSGVSDVTTRYVVHLLSDRDVTKTFTTSEQQSTSALVRSVCREHGVVMQPNVQSVVGDKNVKEILPGLAGQKVEWLEASQVFDVVECTLVTHLGFRQHVHQPSNPQYDGTIQDTVREKVELVKALCESFVTISLPAKETTVASDPEQLLCCSFALPASHADTPASAGTLLVLLWNYTCALQFAVMTTNLLVSTLEANTKTSRGSADVSKLHKRLLQRVQTCWILQQRLQSVVDEAEKQVKDRSVADQPDVVDLQLHLEEMEKNGELSSLGSRLTLPVVSSVFESLWKQQSSSIESGLEIELFRSFPAQIRHNAVDSALGVLVSNSDGKRTLKYLSRRLFDYAEQLAEMDRGGLDGSDNPTDDEDPDPASSREWVRIGTVVLCDALSAVIQACRSRHYRSQDTVLAQSRHNDWEERVIELLAKGAIDVRIRRQSSSWQTHCEILFRAITRVAIHTQDRGLVCDFMDILLALGAKTRRQYQLCQLSLALLHVPFPFSSLTTSKPTVKMPARLPLPQSTPTILVLNHLKPMPSQFHHIIYLLIGVWSVAPTLRMGLSAMVYITEEMDQLVHSVTSSGRARRGSDPEAEDNDDGWIAKDGEHRILKNLTNDSLPVFIEITVTCLALSPARSLGGADDVPLQLMDIVGSLTALARCFDIFVNAESSGFNLPVRTCSTILRAGPTVVKSVEQVVHAYGERRHREPTSHAPGAADIDTLLEAVYLVALAIDRAAQTFQDKLVVKMQQNNRVPVRAASDAPDATPTKRRRVSARGWSNDLLSQAHGKSFQRRQALSKGEAKLLPFFLHSADKLKTLVAEQSGVYNVEIDLRRVQDNAAVILDSFRTDQTEVEHLRALAMGIEDDAATNPGDVEPSDALDEAWGPLEDDTIEGSENDVDYAEGDSSDELDENSPVSDVEEAESDEGVLDNDLDEQSSHQQLRRAPQVPQKKREKRYSM